MAGRFHQQHGDHLPRILGWDVAGRIAPIIVADYRRLVDIFGLEPSGVPFTVYVEPGVERISYRPVTIPRSLSARRASRHGSAAACQRTLRVWEGKGRP
jgi:hypothetical protein